jgi:tetratricopeptide (TPR) repeat protein
LCKITAFDAEKQKKWEINFTICKIFSNFAPAKAKRTENRTKNTLIMADKIKIVRQGGEEIQPALNKREDFILKYKNIIIGCIAALVVIIVGIVFWNNHKKAQLEAAQTASSVPQMSLQTAMTALQSGISDFGEQNYLAALNGDSATKSMGFLKIADEYSSTPAGNVANLYAGLCYAHMDKWEDAVKYLEKFDDAGDMLISPAALGALGNAYAHVNKLDDAVKTLQKAGEKANNILLTPIYYVQAGEILESQGKKAEALELYKKVKQYERVSGVEGISQSSLYVDLIDEYIERVSQ